MRKIIKAISLTAAVLVAGSCVFMPIMAESAPDTDNYVVNEVLLGQKNGNSVEPETFEDYTISSSEWSGTLTDMSIKENDAVTPNCGVAPISGKAISFKNRTQALRAFSSPVTTGLVVFSADYAQGTRIKSFSLVDSQGNKVVKVGYDLDATGAKTVNMIYVNGESVFSTYMRTTRTEQMSVKDMVLDIDKDTISFTVWFSVREGTTEYWRSESKTITGVSLDDVAGLLISGDGASYGGFVDNIALYSMSYDENAPTPSPTSEPTPAPEPQMVFDLDFNDRSVTPNIGAATEGTNKGLYAKSYDGSMAYKFNTSYFKPTAENGAPLLTGLKEFTVSYWANTGTSVGWTLFAAPNTNKQSLRYETYIGILDNNTEITVERYLNNGSRPTNAKASGLKNGWKHIVMVQREKTSELYVDGVRVSSVSSDADVDAILGESPIIQVGKGNWSGGEYATGLIDNYHIYNYALSQSEITAIHDAEVPPPKVVWDTKVDSIKVGKGDEATGTLRFLASVTDAGGYDISKGEYGFVFVNFEPGTVLNNYLGRKDIPEFSEDTGAAYIMKSIASSGLSVNKTYYADITNISSSVSKIGFYAVPYVKLEDGTVMYGQPFTAKKFNWISNY